jgi:hypothetical protein
MTYDPPQESPDPDEESPSSLRRQLSRQAAELKKAQDDLASRDRDLAFTKVGLPSSPMATFFQDNYTGDNSEEAIRAAATDLGLIGNPDDTTNASVAAIDQMSADATGATSMMAPDEESRMHVALQAIKPGPRYAEEVQQVLRSFGRPTAMDDS